MPTREGIEKKAKKLSEDMDDLETFKVSPVNKKDKNGFNKYALVEFKFKSGTPIVYNAMSDAMRYFGGKTAWVSNYVLSIEVPVIRQ